MRRPRRKSETRIDIANDDTCEYKDQEIIHTFSNTEEEKLDENKSKHRTRHLLGICSQLKSFAGRVACVNILRVKALVYQFIFKYLRSQNAHFPAAPQLSQTPRAAG